MNKTDKDNIVPEIEDTIAAYFEEINDMGIKMQLTPFGKGYRLKIGNIDIFFENEDLTYTGYGIYLGRSNYGINEKGEIVKDEE